jgi:hypothetical protein
MAQSISCPSCGKRFVPKPQLVGKRVKCTACAEPFTVQPLDERVGTPAAPVAASVPARFALPSRRSARAAASEGGGGARGAYFLGVAMMVMGVLALILPFFGLQFRAILESKADSTGVAIGLIIGGAVVCVLAAMGKWGQLIVRIVVWWRSCGAGTTNGWPSRRGGTWNHRHIHSHRSRRRRHRAFPRSNRNRLVYRPCRRFGRKPTRSSSSNMAQTMWFA